MGEPIIRNKTWNWSYGSNYSQSGRGNIQGNFDTSGSIHGSMFTPAGSFGSVGQTNPYHWTQQQQGIDATTPFTGTDMKGSGSWFTVVAESTWQSNTDPGQRQFSGYSVGGYPSYSQVPTFLVGPPASVVADVTNAAIRKFISKANAALSSTNLTGRSIKHLKHDLHSLVHPMNGVKTEVVKYLDSVTKLSKYRLPPAKLLTILRQSYLEFTFGMSPFAEDVTAILVDASRRRFPTVPISASKRKPFAGSSDKVQFGPSTGFPPTVVQPTYNCQITSTFGVKLKGAIRTRTGMDGKVSIIQDNRLSPSDWAPTLFSIIPYAWMINYFTNIDDIIDALSFCSANLAWACKDSSTTLEADYSDLDPMQWASVGSSFHYVNQVITAYGGSGYFLRSSIARVHFTADDLVVSLRFKIPTSPHQYLNMFAAFLPRITGVTKLLAGAVRSAGK